MLKNTEMIEQPSLKEMINERLAPFTFGVVLF